jgi:hypothetical protein
MANNIVTQVRAALSSLTDDYFKDEHILDWANQAYTSVVSSAIKLELDQPLQGARSVRALDALRKKHTFSELEYEQFRSFFRVDVDIKQEIESQFKPMIELYLGGQRDGCGPVIVSEIVSSRKHRMDWGVMFPTPQQVFYERVTEETDDEGTPVMTKNIIFYVDQDDESLVINMDYIRQPRMLTEESESLPDLPDRLINAVVVKTALQAGVSERREGAENYQTLYDREIRENLW